MAEKARTTQMPQFEESLWADSEFSQNYRDDANIFLPFRRQFIEITKSFYGHFISQNIEANVLDLGCGDGLFMQELLKLSPETGREVPEISRKEIRKIIFGNYRIIYRIEKTRISMLTICHGKQILPVNEILEAH